MHDGAGEGAADSVSATGNKNRLASPLVVRGVREPPLHNLIMR